MPIIFRPYRPTMPAKEVLDMFDAEIAGEVKTARDALIKVRKAITDAIEAGKIGPEDLDVEAINYIMWENSSWLSVGRSHDDEVTIYRAVLSINTKVKQAGGWCGKVGA